MSSWSTATKAFTTAAGHLLTFGQIHNIRAGDAAIVSYKITFLSAVTGAIIVAQLQLPNAGAAAAA